MQDLLLLGDIETNTANKMRGVQVVAFKMKVVTRKWHKKTTKITLQILNRKVKIWFIIIWCYDWNVITFY